MVIIKSTCCFVPELFQTYTRRKAAKERAKQTEGVQHTVQDNKTSRETTKMALPQFEREKKNYTPSKYDLVYFTYSIPRTSVGLSTVMNCIPQVTTSLSLLALLWENRAIKLLLER